MEQMIKELRDVNPELATLFAALERQHNRSVFYRTVAIMSVVLLAVTGWFSALQYNKAHDAADAAKGAAEVVRTSALENCRNSAQPGGVRFIIAEQIRQQIQQSDRLNYEQFFPNVPPDELHKLIAAQRERQKKQVQALLNVNCDALYPQP